MQGIARVSCKKDSIDLIHFIAFAIRETKEKQKKEAMHKAQPLYEKQNVLVKRQ